ncbi:U-box domain-containing protein 4-like [Bidens hawaiensis]|uniref:U-box domain-containing protein 4-like n=1 Tax=Bidens hawaiensis TaxID=980011 RepID=UPI004049EF7A
MEISLLLKNISSFFNLQCHESILVQKYYQKTEAILKLIKPLLESVVVAAQVASDESVEKEFAGLNQSVDELRKLLEDYHPLMSQVYFVMQVESLIAKVRDQSLQLLELLKSSPNEFSSSSLELYVQKIKRMGYEKESAILSKAIRDQAEGSAPSADNRSIIVDFLNLRSNQELLIEAVALEKLKENAEQAEKMGDLECVEEMLSLVSHMNDKFIEVRQSQNCNRVPIPPDFCCPLSLKLMTDPVIVASGQTYEREYIRKWLDLGLTVCPKTMQTLVHTNLIPNYTVKALIASWCESHNVKLPDTLKSLTLTLTQPTSPGKSTTTHQEETATSLAHHTHSSSEDSLPEPAETDYESAESGDHSLESIDIGGVNEKSTPDPQPATTQKTPLFSPRFEPRPKNPLWRRPSERYGPRIISSPATETRPDLIKLETQVKRLVDDLTDTSLDVLRNSTSQLRLLSRHNMDNRIVIANCGAISLLTGLLRSTDQKVQENAVTILLNLSINDNNKLAIANAGAIEPLIHVLETGSSEATENSAATLFSLSVIEENKIRIGRSGAVKPLVDLLASGSPRGKKDAATALFNLSLFHENKARIVEAGAVRHLVELMDPAAGMVDKAVSVLSNLATIPEGRAAIGGENGIPGLVEVVELGSARGKENAAAALLQVCTDNGRFCKMVLQEGAVPPLTALSQSGTARAKEKASLLLNYFRSQRHGNNGRG